MNNRKLQLLKSLQVQRESLAELRAMSQDTHIEQLIAANMPYETLGQRIGVMLASIETTSKELENEDRQELVEIHIYKAA